jgi:hypothetical protein
MRKTSNASVLLFSLMLISIIVVMTEQLIRGVMVGAGFSKTMINREHAEMLALGGINIAIAQLTYNKDEKEKTAPEKPGAKPEASPSGEQESLTPLQKFVFHLTSNLNRWQSFELDPDIDGISGTVKICITSEHGKININNAFDFKKQKFKKEFKFLLGGLEIPGKLRTGELFKKISEFLKNRGKKLYDVSELLNITGLEDANFNVFYDPPRVYKKDEKQPSVSLALQDIFTIWTDNEKIDPILLSSALCSIFSVRRPEADDAKKYKERFWQLAKEFKEDWGKDWDTNWKHLQGIYDNKPPQLSNIKDILVEKFNPKVYSVLSYGRVGQVEQRVLAIIKETETKEKGRKEEGQEAEKGSTSEQAAAGKAQQEKDQVKRTFKVERVYWL